MSLRACPRTRSRKARSRFPRFFGKVVTGLPKENAITQQERDCFPGHLNRKVLRNRYPLSGSRSELVPEIGAAHSPLRFEAVDARGERGQALQDVDQQT